jgi:hypothetical protein
MNLSALTVLSFSNEVKRIPDPGFSARHAENDRKGEAEERKNMAALLARDSSLRPEMKTRRQPRCSDAAVVMNID